MKKETKNHKKGFTLLELLVVVLIIGILAAIALPQYKMAVTKAKVASILPIMRAWYNYANEYRLQHNEYPDMCDDADICWPENFCGCYWDSDNTNFWTECFAYERTAGEVYCRKDIDPDNYFVITMYQPDETDYNDCRGKLACEAEGSKGNKFCKAIGGKFMTGIKCSYNTDTYFL